jgi:hypothetical protein
MRAQPLTTNTHRIQNGEVHKKNTGKTKVRRKPMVDADS